ncbi:MAG: hypothetical protein Q9165_008468 [Trypethelium subeluteriae]
MSSRKVRPISFGDLPVEIIWIVADLLPAHAVWCFALTNATMKKVTEARLSALPDWEDGGAVILTDPDPDECFSVRAEIIRFLHLIQRDHPGTAICSLCRSLHHVRPITNTLPNPPHVKNPCSRFSEVSLRCNKDPANLLADLVGDADIKQKSFESCKAKRFCKYHPPYFHAVAKEVDIVWDFQQRLRFQLCLNRQELGPLYGKAVPSGEEKFPDFPVPISRQRAAIVTAESSECILRLQDTLKFGPYGCIADIMQTFLVLYGLITDMPSSSEVLHTGRQSLERPYDLPVCRQLLRDWLSGAWRLKERPYIDREGRASISLNQSFTGRCQDCRTQYRMFHEVSPLEAGQCSSQGHARIETRVELSRELVTTTSLDKGLAGDIPVMAIHSPRSKLAKASRRPILTFSQHGKNHWKLQPPML